MKLRKPLLYSLLVPALALMSFSSAAALADEGDKSREPTAASAKAGSAKPAPQSSDGQPENRPVRESQDQVRQLSEKVERLEALIEQQQRQLAALERKLEGGGAKPEPAALDAKAAANARVERAAGIDAAAKSTEPPKSMEAAKSTESAQAQSQPTASEKPALLAGWDKGRAFLRSSDGSFETFIGGYGQLDFRGYQSGEVAPANTFLVRRARLIVEGKVQRYYDFKIEGDFADRGGIILRDLFVRVHRIDELQLSFGQFRVPFSQEEIRS
ncbi:MAG TPA: porin, partial [Blastocatellia bacterium]|nr:porin [Blastocatellia bacterium]